MGLMYWQINDIWQAPTWSSIEYNLKWKMAHYYVKHMYSPVYPIIQMTPYLPEINDSNAHVSIYIANDFFTASSGEMNCYVYGLDQFLPRLSFVYEIEAEPLSVTRITDLSYWMLIYRAGFNLTNPSILHCIYYTSDESYYMSQTLFLRRPKDYTLHPTKFTRDYKLISPNEVEITITADKPGLFVWLDFKGNVTLIFSKNGFHIFDPTTKILASSWTSPISVEEVESGLDIKTLYDVTLS